MNSLTRIKLSLMMFLEFFIWGAWFVTMNTYLAKALSSEGFQIGAAYSTQSLGAIIAPFIIGLIADRYFAAQRILGFLHLIGAVLLFLAARAESFTQFYPFILAYMIIYMPTLALVNSVSFRQLTDPSKQFGSIRVFGTIGWIVAGLIISYVMHWEDVALRNTFYMASGVSAFLGFFSFLLPDTPPQGNSHVRPTISQILGLDALKLLKNKSYLGFFVASILICIPLAFYYQYAYLYLDGIGMKNAAGNLTFGQISEVAFMLLLPLFFKRFGLKTTLLVGMAAWAIRYMLFAYGNAGPDTVWMLFLGILLHGICYDFFFVSGQIYTDYKAGEKIKSAAQGLITLATYGLGMLIGFWLAGIIYDHYVLPDGGHDWKMIWTIPAIIAFVVLLSFALIFKNEKITSVSPNSPDASTP